MVGDPIAVGMRRASEMEGRGSRNRAAKRKPALSIVLVGGPSSHIKAGKFTGPQRKVASNDGFYT